MDHGVLSREDAEARLIAAGAADGLYLLRESPKRKGQHLISVCRLGKMEHYLIQEVQVEDHVEYVVDGSDAAFPSIPAMIDFYHRGDSPAPGPLLRPCPQPPAAVTAAPAARANGSVSAFGNPFASPATAHVPHQPKSPTTGRSNPFSAELPHVPAPTRPSVASRTSSATGSVSSMPSTPLADASSTSKQPTERRGTLTGLKKNAAGIIVQSGARGDVDGRELLLCEGYLKKYRGMMQTRSRWFTLTTHRLLYYAHDAGDLIAGTQLLDIEKIEDLPGTKKWRITTKHPFGTSGAFEMTLEAPNERVKAKWFDALTKEASALQGFNSNRAELIMEGELLKVQPFGTTSKLRWFRVTTKKFAYYRDEAGEEMGSVPFEYITQITLATNNKRDFVVSSVQPFTKTGAYEVRCRCATEAVRVKWITGLRKVVPTAKFVESVL